MQYSIFSDTWSSEHNQIAVCYLLSKKQTVLQLNESNTQLMIKKKIEQPQPCSKDTETSKESLPTSPINHKQWERRKAEQQKPGHGMATQPENNP